MVRSFKGVAQLIEIDAAVNLTHIMEDCFLAAQQQTITLGTQQIDLLLHGVAPDHIIRLSFDLQIVRCGIRVEPDNH